VANGRFAIPDAPKPAPLSKEERAAELAMTAGIGTEWGDDLLTGGKHS
jgi:hypothetical protein